MGVAERAVEERLAGHHQPGRLGGVAPGGVGGGRTKVVITALFLEKADLDAMIEHGMEEGMAQSWEALDGVLAEVQAGVGS